MKKCISNISIIALRAEPAEKSEMCTQILFGEKYIVIEEGEKWSQVRLDYDNYEGWIDNKVINEITEDEYSAATTGNSLITTDVINTVQPVKGYNHFLVVAGSTLPQYDEKANTFQLGSSTYNIMKREAAKCPDNPREIIIENALKYFNAPYLWGGRSPFGIDCSGFTQILYKMAGISLPRDASGQVEKGGCLSFVEEAMPGDLAFFDDEDGAITHVGIIWGKNKIIHASGQVRIDNVDQFGIYNVDTKRHTHKLRLMRKIIT